MGFIKASQTPSRGGNSRLAESLVVVSIYNGKKSSQTLSVTLHKDAMTRMRLQKGDAVDVGVDRENNQLLVEAASGESALLSLSASNSTTRLKVQCTIRREWEFHPESSITAREAKVVQMRPGFVVCDLPVEWIDL